MGKSRDPYLPGILGGVGLFIIGIELDKAFLPSSVMVPITVGVTLIWFGIVVLFSDR
jgi:hypothetical protein